MEQLALTNTAYFILLLAVVNPLNAAKQFATLQLGSTHSPKNVIMRASIYSTLLMVATSILAPYFMYQPFVKLPIMYLVAGLLLSVLSWQMLTGYQPLPKNATAFPALIPITLPCIVSPALISMLIIGRDLHFVMSTIYQHILIDLSIGCIVALALSCAHHYKEAIHANLLHCQNTFLGAISSFAAINCLAIGLSGLYIA